MNYLAIDTSGSWLTVAAGGKNKAVRHIADCRLNHSVVLMDEIEKCLEEAGYELKDIDVFACALGAGSFTGIRIGISTVKAFAYALGKKVLGVTSFESIAYDISDGNDRLAVIDAKHGNYYVCGFDGTNSVILPPEFVDSSKVVALSADYEIISDSASEYFDCAEADVARGFINAVEAKLDLATFDTDSLIPMYVKKSQAEEEL